MRYVRAILGNLCNPKSWNWEGLISGRGVFVNMATGQKTFVHVVTTSHNLRVRIPAGEENKSNNVEAWRIPLAAQLEHG